MKILWFILVPFLAAVAWLAWPAADAGRQAAADSAPISWQGSPPTLILKDAEEVFKKAFWRRPAPTDQIQHAERHEWLDSDGLARWQWFLVLSASPELIKYLRDDNAFGLMPASAAPVVNAAPAWFLFKPEDVTVLKASRAGMCLMFSKSDDTLFATGSGRGFSKGAPEPPSVIQGVPVHGRLPITSPPIPKPQ